MSDEERLRNAMIYGTSHPEIYKTAQDEELERLRAENERLRKALKPFADAKHLDEITYGHFSAAAVALGESDNGGI